MSESVEQACRVTVLVTCKACDGTGKSPWHEGRCCDQCDGFGKVRKTEMWK